MAGGHRLASERTQDVSRLVNGRGKPRLHVFMIKCLSGIPKKLVEPMHADLAYMLCGCLCTLFRSYMQADIPNAIMILRT